MGHHHHKHKKGDRKEEKKKKDKKSDKKRDRSRNEEERSSKDVDLNIGCLLSVLFSSFPEMIQEFPSMISSLDCGEGIFTSSIRNEKKRLLIDQIFSKLPLSPENGWHKTNMKESIRKPLLRELYYSEFIIQPADMTESMQRSSRFSAIKYLDLLQKHPTIVGELSSVLDVLLHKEHVNIDGIDDQSVAACLKGFFESMNLDFDEDDGYSIGRSSTSKEIVKYFRNNLKMIKKYNESTDSPSVLAGKAATGQQQSSDEESSDSEDSSDDDDDDHRNHHPHIPINDHMSIPSNRDITNMLDACEEGNDNQVNIGPAKPSSAQVQWALKNTDFSTLNSNEDDSSEEENVKEWGPLPSMTSMARNRLRLDNQPLAFTGNEDQDIDDKATGSGFDEHWQGSQDVTEREEWMLTPGERDVFSGAKMPSNRKFHSGIQAHKAAKEMQKQREALEKERLNSPEYQETQALLKEFREKRGPSLMDQHLASSSSSSSSSKNGSQSGSHDVGKNFEGKSKRSRANDSQDLSNVFSFDPEKDMTAVKKLNAQDVKKLVDQCKQLDSRFSKGFVQGSFF